VYFSGEPVTCTITFKNHAADAKSKSQSNDDSFETLAWASVQIHCQCIMSEVKVKCVNDHTIQETNTISEETSFMPFKGEKGKAVVSTKPKILFCDLQLLPGESKTFTYREVIPFDCPPSYKGQGLRYCYKLTIGTQRVNAPIKLLRLPLRVLVLQGIDTRFFGDVEEVAPSNPFCDNQPKDSPLDLAIEALEQTTSRKNLGIYNITSAKGRVAKFTLFKQSYKLGEDIIGMMNFADGTVPCVQYLVTLHAEETIAEEHRIKKNQQPVLVSHSKCHEVCLGLLHTQFVLPIPLQVTPTFSTDLVQLNWKLHFEFVISITDDKPVAVDNYKGDGQILRGPSSLNVETMIWDLPIKIYPTKPSHIALGLRMQDSLVATV